MIWLSTSNTPGTTQPARSTCSLSAQESTLPLRIILPPRVSTVIRRASSASRLLLRPFHLTANTNVFAQKENGADYAAPSIKLNDVGL